MSDWKTIDRLKAQLAEDEAKVRSAEAELGVPAIASLIVGLSAYAEHSAGCRCLTPEARARWVLTKKVECTCGRNFELERAHNWVRRHAPDVYRMVMGVTPGDA